MLPPNNCKIVEIYLQKNVNGKLTQKEQINNPDFKGGEFDSFLFEAGSYSFTLAKGNIRDDATLEQLVVLSNLESINALLIRQGLEQSERLKQLNQIAITQMTSLVNTFQPGSLKYTGRQQNVFIIT